jgi:rieske iron-sulfur protein
MSPKPADTPDPSCCYTRRQWLQNTFGVVALGLVGTADAAILAAAKMPPQIGDELCFPSWENEGRLITPADVVLNNAPLVVYPRDPASQIVREKSRINQILLLKVDPATLDQTTLRHAVDGVVAFSGVCTHAACAVSEWNGDSQRLICPCHGSEYDVTQHAKVVAGPAPRPLPSLPIKLSAQTFVINGPFSGKVGLKKL